MRARRSPPSAERLVLVAGSAVAVTLAAVSLVLPRVTTVDALTNPSSPWIALIDVRSEANVHTWFNVALLAAAAAAYVALGYVARSLGRPAWTWLLIACVLAALSLDDMIAVHERLESIGRALGGGSGGLHFAWVVPGGIAAAAVLAAAILAGRRLPARTRAYLLSGMLLLIVAALGLEVVGGALLDGRGDGPAYILVSHLEELLETFAAVLLLNSAVVAAPRATTGGAGTPDENAVM